MRTYILIFNLLIVSAKLFSQTETDYLKIKGTITETKSESPMEKVFVAVSAGNKTLQIVSTDSLGNYELDNLALNQMYMILFYKKKYCNKIAALNVTNPGGEELDGTFPMEINTSLFRVGIIKKFRLRFMKKEPVALAEYNSEEDNMVWNMEYIEYMAEKIKSKGGQ